MATYGNRFQRLDDEASIRLWLDAWSDGLAGVTGEQMQYGLDLSTRQYPDFPPTLPQFKQCCLAKSAPVEQYERLPYVWKVTEHGKTAMAKIREMLGLPEKELGEGK